MKKLLAVGICINILVLLLYQWVATDRQEHNSTNNTEHYYNSDSKQDVTVDVDTKETYKQINTDKNGITIKDDEVIDKVDDLHNSFIKLDTKPTSLTVLVNKEFGVDPSFVPNNMRVPAILFDFDSYDEKKLLREEAATAIELMFNDAAARDIELVGISGYRSYQRQNSIYNKNLRTKGIILTNLYSAKPGYSEHQTGLAIDVSSASIKHRLIEEFENTKEGIWLSKECYKYGFIIRYPKGKEHITGYSYEPWHIRYVGVSLATYLTIHQLTLEEYYGYTPSEDFINQTTYDNIIDIDQEITAPAPKKNSTKTPTPEPSETPEPSKSPKPSKSPTPSKIPSQLNTVSPEESPNKTSKPTTTEPFTTSRPIATAPVSTQKPETINSPTTKAPESTKAPATKTPEFTPTPAPTEEPRPTTSEPAPSKTPSLAEPAINSQNSLVKSD